MGFLQGGYFGKRSCIYINIYIHIYIYIYIYIEICVFAVMVNCSRTAAQHYSLHWKGGPV